MIENGAFPLFTGRATNVREPDWSPLERLTDDDDLILGQFMWMHCARLEDERVVHAYKHIETRQYLYLAGDLTAFAYRGDHDHEYASVPLGIALREVFCLCRELGQPEEAELRANETLIERHSRYPRVS